MKIRTKLIISSLVSVIFAVIIVALPIAIGQAKKEKGMVAKVANLQIENVYTGVELFLQAPLNDIDAIMNYMDSEGFTNKAKIERFMINLSKEKTNYAMMYVASVVPVIKGGYIFNDQHWTPPVDFDQTTRGWYKSALTTRNATFSDPYVDAKSGDIVVTISQAYYNNNEFKAIVAVDLSINKIQEIANNVMLSKSGKAFMVDKDGKYVTNPDGKKIGNANFYEEYGFTNLKNKAAANKTLTDFNAGTKYFAARRMPSLCGWTLVTFGPTKEIYASVNKMLKNISILSVFSIIFSIIISIIVALSVTKKLKVIGVSLEEIASGNADLTKRLQMNTKDEIGQVADGFNKFTEKLQGIIGQVKTSSTDLGTAGEDLIASSEDTASAITQIIANIDSVHSQINNQTNSVSQTAGAVNQIASNIQSLGKLIENQATGVAQASSAVEEMIGNINAVNSSVEKMAGSFDSLQDDAQTGANKQQDVNDKIAQIENQSQMLQEANSAISAIAEQTNLLAMNAAIEAAHAGEAGKGFSVVADEIRKLSETSAEQSRTIGEQLTNIQESITDVVTASSESSDAFLSVSSKIKETDQIVRQIKAAMEEQQSGSKQITDALHMMNESTSEVRSASMEMEEGNKLILGEVQQLQDATLAMRESMDEMKSGARKINETGTALSDISAKMKDAINDITNEIDKFTV